MQTKNIHNHNLTFIQLKHNGHVCYPLNENVAGLFGTESFSKNIVSNKEVTEKHITKKEIKQ